MIWAYLERYETLPILLSKPCLDNVHDTSRISLSLFPTLLSAANAAKRTGPNNNLIGLLAATGKSIGPIQSNGKRCVSGMRFGL
jgi:hypothetical protein